MDIRIGPVDHAPDDLYRQTPLRGRLIRMLAGPRRADYWLVELRRPVTWPKDGETRTIRHLVVSARWQGTSIHPGAKIPVQIAYVVDDALLASESFGPGQTEYVAIGMAKVSRMPAFWSKIWARYRTPR